jgi:hypothetical protein
MLKKITALCFASVLSLTTLAASTKEAEAGRGSRLGFGIAAGILGATALGAFAYGGPRYYGAGAYYGPRYYGYSGGYGHGCYKGPRQCDWSGNRCWINSWGERVCRGGEWHCWRPTVCD